MPVHQLPLFKNHHTHPSVFATLEKGLSIADMEDKSQALDAIQSLSSSNGEGTINLVLGWNNSRYTFAPEELDQLPPLFICNVSFHEFILNGPGREQFKADYPELVANLDDTDWIERNLHQVLKFIAGASNLSARDIEKFYGKLAQDGTWTAEEKLLPGSPVIQLFKDAGCYHRTLLWADLESFKAMSPEDRDGVYGIKLFLDGAVGARTAALNHPYLSGGGNGLLLHTESQLMEMVLDIMDYRKPVSVHAIGDRAVEQLIAVLEHLENSQGSLPPQIRLEHCQFITKDQAQRAKALGVILSMQPNFSEDSIQYTDRLDPTYLRVNNPFRMLIDQAGFIPGQDLVFGTDGPPHSAEYALKTALFPPLESQALTLDEIKAGYCINTLTPGYVEADIDMDGKSIRARTILTPHLT